jgi:hypothetical protein
MHGVSMILHPVTKRSGREKELKQRRWHRTKKNPEIVDVEEL